MNNVWKSIALPVAVLGFYPLSKILGDMIGEPDIRVFLKLIWATVFAYSMTVFYKEIKK